MVKALNTLFEQPLFRKYPEKHVFLTNNEYMFNHMQFTHGKGFTYERLNRIKKATVVKDKDLHYWQHYVNSPAGKQTDWGNKRNATAEPCFNHSFAIGFGHEASIPEYSFQIASYNVWKNKTFHFFYHTRHEKSLNNSTQYRHAPVNPSIISQLDQPSSVGFDIPSSQWALEFSDSKYCLVIRGDNPASRSMFRAIRAGCMPVIISDALPYYHPMFRSFLTYQDFSIVVSEQEFVKDPVQTLSKATNLSEAAMQQKVGGLALLQRILVLDHPLPLFVPAFVQEVVASQQDSYYQFENDFSDHT